MEEQQRCGLPVPYRLFAQLEDGSGQGDHAGIAESVRKNAGVRVPVTKGVFPLKYGDGAGARSAGDDPLGVDPPGLRPVQDECGGRIEVIHGHPDGGDQLAGEKLLRSQIGGRGVAKSEAVVDRDHIHPAAGHVVEEARVLFGVAVAVGEAAAEEEEQAGALLVRRLHGGVTVQIEGGIPLHGVEHRALADFGARYGPCGQEQSAGEKDSFHRRILFTSFHRKRTSRPGSESPAGASSCRTPGSCCGADSDPSGIARRRVG